MCAHRPLVLHLSADYPDPVRDRTTLAVKNFIDRLDDADHVVVSLKRLDNPMAGYCREYPWVGNRKIVAVGYWAPPAALGHRLVVRSLAARTGGILDRLSRRPSLIHAHKVSLEGPIARALGQGRGIPYVCSVRGEVEEKFLRYRPDLHRMLGAVVRDAQALFYVSAWFKPHLDARFPGQVRRESLLPNFTGHAIVPRFEPFEERRLLTIMDLNVYRKKGLPVLLAALAQARRTVPGLRLDVIGWSSPKIMAEVERLVAGHGLGDAVRFLGVLPNEEVLARLSGYAAFVLPSRNETFGMSYVEALLSGVPILYSQGTGIDGYLDGLEVGIGAPVGDVDAVAAGLCRLSTDAGRLRAVLKRDYATLRRRFLPDAYLATYRAHIVRDQGDRAAAAAS